MRRYIKCLLVFCLSVGASAAWAAPDGPRGQQNTASERKPSSDRKPSSERKASPDKPAADKGWLGVEARNLTPEDIARAAGGPLQGIRVVGIAEGSPAVGALAQGDLLVSLDGREIDSVKMFFGILSGKAPGKEIKLGVSRGARKRMVALKLGVRPGAKPAAPAVAAPASPSPENGAGKADIPGVAFMSAGPEEKPQTAGREAAAPSGAAGQWPWTGSPAGAGAAPPTSASAHEEPHPPIDQDTASQGSTTEETAETPATDAADASAGPSAKAGNQNASLAEDAQETPSSETPSRETPSSETAPSFASAAPLPDAGAEGKPAPSLELAAGASNAGQPGSEGGEEKKVALNELGAAPPAVQPSGGQDAPAAGEGNSQIQFAAREPQASPAQEAACEGLTLSVGPAAAPEQRCLAPGKGRAREHTFRDCPVCPAMAVVPPGTFVMGSPRDELGDRSSGEPEHNKREDPQHLVTIPYALAVGKFTVTFEEWDACHAEGGCGEAPPSDKGWGRGRRPAINVSWAEAKAYVKWLSQKTGREYRLLSESEREYVARAGSTSAFWWGATATTDKANFSYDQKVNGETKFENEPGGKHRDQTLPVDDLQPNPWGLHHVHGNVAEWVEDCWHDSYKNKPEELKKTGGAWKTGDCFYRVKRGGGYDSLRIYLRSAYRGYGEFDSKEANTGFRVARNLGP